MGKRTYEDVTEYVEWQSKYKCKVLSAKPEHKFNDLGVEVRVWNVKTDVDGSWWVVEGDETPMNLYTQDAFYFGTDEVYSFHMGIMERMRATAYKPEDYIKAMTLENDIAPQLFRKLKVIASLIDDAIETEDFQAIGVQCRETLIELGNLIYFDEMADEEEQPQASNFKKKAELFIQFFMSGSENSDYRKIIRKLTEATWDYANKITHSQNTTFYEASTCVSLCTSLVSAYENVRQKVFDPISSFKCNNCKSKRLDVIEHQVDDDGLIINMILKCDECGSMNEVDFSDFENGKVKFFIENEE